MRKFVLLALSGLLAVSAGGCNFFGGDDEVAEDPVVESVPVPAEQAAQPETPEPIDAETPVVQQPSASAIAGPDLIRSTNANERLRQINQGQRQDPFATVTIAPPPPPQPATPTTAVPANIPPIPSVPTTAAGQPVPQQPQAIAQRPQAPGTGAQAGRGTQAAGGGAAARGAQPGGGTTPPSILPGPLERGVANLPPIPQPDLAAAVIVTGVVQVGSTPHAIINAPNEAASRYVQVGQRIANGQVLVKRIEMGGASEPIVVLEQNGIEVARRVGEGLGGGGITPGAASASAPTAAQRPS